MMELESWLAMKPDLPKSWTRVSKRLELSCLCCVIKLNRLENSQLPPFISPRIGVGGLAAFKVTRGLLSG